MNVIPRFERSNFDSKLEIPSATRAVNCVLRIELRILLLRLDQTSFSIARRRERGGRIVTEPDTYRCRAWTDAEWRDFCFRFRHINEHFWNNRFWLQPPDGFSELDLPLGRPSHRPNLECQLRLEIMQGAAAPAHAQIEVVHLADDERDMRSNSGTYDHRDVHSDTRYSNRTGSRHAHITVVHEVAHLLDLDHPGVAAGYPECSVDGNRRICYGRTAEARDQVTGSGLAVNAYHATPWLSRVAMHTRARRNAWTLLRRAEPPSPLSIIRIRQRSSERIRERLIRSTEDL